ncbi:MAG TPA: hypothetical protein VGH50_03500 [Candidatus Binatia bacterium]|jgi:hypothetical protein
MPQGSYIPEWPKDSIATRSLRQKCWTVVLRCYACNRRFAVAHVPLDRLALAPQVMRCLHCDAQPRLGRDGRLHRIIDLRQEKSGSSSFGPGTT